MFGQTIAGADKLRHKEMKEWTGLQVFREYDSEWINELLKGFAWHCVEVD